jgi:hypothetical protein
MSNLELKTNKVLRQLELQADFAIANNLEYVAVDPKTLQRLLKALSSFIDIMNKAKGE